MDNKNLSEKIEERNEVCLWACIIWQLTVYSVEYFYASVESSRPLHAFSFLRAASSRRAGKQCRSISGTVGLSTKTLDYSIMLLWDIGGTL